MRHDRDPLTYPLGAVICDAFAVALVLAGFIALWICLPE